MKNILLCGVGGQGTVLASRLLALAAMEKGLEAKGAETIGMAQRGGSVVSHVRIGTDIYSPLIPKKSADCIIGFEPGEAVRCLPYLKEGGCVIVCPDAVSPVMDALAGGSYDGKEAIEYLKQQVTSLHIVDGAEICRQCGSPKVLNIALLGAAAAAGEAGADLEEIRTAMEKRVPEKYREMNEKALKLGAEAIRKQERGSRP